jgi:hypothetical protein
VPLFHVITKKEGGYLEVKRTGNPTPPLSLNFLRRGEAAAAIQAMFYTDAVKEKKNPQKTLIYLLK